MTNSATIASDSTGKNTEIKRAGKYLTFHLGKEEYGVGILKVKEIIGIMEITQVPNMPHYAKGVVNLRGKVIPIIDLRDKFSMAEKEYDTRTCIIVVETKDHGGAAAVIGIVVDEVSEVRHLTEKEIEPPPDFGVSNQNSNVLGMAKQQGKVIILLDIDRVLTAEEMFALTETA
ncbi:MAG: chemotaxis protein CheW [Deltaproteobacteria bacterium RIFOXYD12_FULL_50_9]|nr:MAG: chemotaxis protein CheW [Deltaproteobacteria bacterium RIFOXYD12_FULL_50_9]